MVKFRSLASALLLALISPKVNADVTPSEPGPGAVFRAGGRCRVTWIADPDSATAWKDMAIQLMSGSNLAMVHLTTVTTGQDGTKDGSFEYTCPEVDPYSAIYFYQFTSPHTTVKTWTTRFTIASATGATTPPGNAKQPGGDDIPWGIGKLVDSSGAVPPPASSAASGSSTVSISSATSAYSNSTARAPSTRTSVLVTSTQLGAATPRITPSGAISAPGSSSTSTSTTSGALPLAAVDGKISMTMLALVVSAFAVAL